MRYVLTVRHLVFIAAALTACLGVADGLWAQIPPSLIPGHDAPDETPADHQNDAEADTADPADEASDTIGSIITDIRLQTLWQANTWDDWMFLLGAILVGLVVGRVFAFGLHRLGSAMEKRRWPGRAHLFNDAANPLALLLLTLAIEVGLRRITMGPHLESFTERTIAMLIAVAVFWYLFNLIGLVDVALRRVTRRTRSELDNQLVPLIRKALRIFLVIIAILFILDAIYDADIGAWLAGLGIAGLAVSLAAQDSLKHLFGSVTIFMDRPFQVGSFVKYADTWGTIEGIGFRSTRLRTLDGHLMTIPNGNIVNDNVSNVGLRPYIRRIIDITITYDTPPEKIQEAIDIVDAMFREQGLKENVWAEGVDDPHAAENFPPRVFFSGFNDASLNIQVWYWFRPPDWWAYLAHATRFNLELFKRYNAAGIDFAFPTQTVHLAGDEQRPLNIGVELARPTP